MKQEHFTYCAEGKKTSFPGDIICLILSAVLRYSEIQVGATNKTMK